MIQTRQGMMPPYSQAAWFAIGWLDLKVTIGLDIDPKTYRRFRGTPIKVLTPENGVKIPENDAAPTPENGEYLDIPSVGKETLPE